MSEQNTDNTDPEPTPTPPSEKRDLTNIEKYNLKKRMEAQIKEAEDQKKAEKAEAKKSDVFLKEALEARKFNAPQYVLDLIEGLDPESQLMVLKAHADKIKDPNQSSIPVPIGREKEPLEEYMIFNPTKETIEYNIPASVLMNPNKNKRLLGLE